jgi:hypothetical protein
LSGALKTATTVVGLLAGIATGIYVLGGLVIALRLLFDHFAFNSVVTILGQLPREPVIATALTDVIGPAVTFGLLAAIYYGLRNRPHSREGESDRLDRGFGWKFLLIVFFPLVSIGLCAPAIDQAYLTEEGFSWLLATSVIGIAVTYAALATAWFLKRRLGRRRSRPRLLRAAAAGALWANVALTPSVMIASALPFEPAQVCTSGGLLPEKGRLIGEGGGRVLLEQESGQEAVVVALPSDQVTRSEFGDLSTGVVCPLPPGQKPTAKAAEAALGGHGSVLERQLAVALRPRLLFDSRERWRPLEVEAFLGEHFVDGGSHQACWDRGGPPCHPVQGLAELQPRASAPDYLDIHGEAENGTDYRSPKRSCHSTVPPAVDCNAGPRTAIYYRRTSHEGRWYWDYWWLYRYNDYTGPLSRCNSRLCSDHEGDWEGITVVTTPTLKPEVVEAIYAAHRNRILVEGQSLPLEDGHLLAFVAEGTHATYPYRCAAGCKQYASLPGIGRIPEDPHDGAVAWGGNADAECSTYRCVRPLPERGDPIETALPQAGAWAGWPGQWGATCHEGCESGLRELQGSPRSPGSQTRFQCPWAATDRALPAADGSGLSRSESLGDAERMLARCAAQRGGL